LQPPVSGLYTFYITCEDECELWLEEANQPVVSDEDEIDNKDTGLLAKLATRTGRLKWDE